MKKTYRCLLMCVCCFQLWAQNVEKFAFHDLENLTEFYLSGDYYLAYENNRYRFEGDALVYVLQNLSFSQDVHRIYILIYNKGIPIVSVKTRADYLERLFIAETSKSFLDKAIKFSFEVDELNARMLRFGFRENSSYKKVDAVVGITLNYTLGNFDNSIRKKINLQPELRTVLGKGFSLQARYSIPTFNELENNKANIILAGATQDYRFKEKTFL